MAKSDSDTISHTRIFRQVRNLLLHRPQSKNPRAEDSRPEKQPEEAEWSVFKTATMRILEEMAVRIWRLARFFRRALNPRSKRPEVAPCKGIAKRRNCCIHLMMRMRKLVCLLPRDFITYLRVSSGRENINKRSKTKNLKRILTSLTRPRSLPTNRRGFRFLHGEESCLKITVGRTRRTLRVGRDLLPPAARWRGKFHTRANEAVWATSRSRAESPRRARISWTLLVRTASTSSLIARQVHRWARIRGRLSSVAVQLWSLSATFPARSLVLPKLFTISLRRGKWSRNFRSTNS